MKTKMTFSRVVNVRCTLQMLQWMTALFYNLDVYQPGEDVTIRKADEKVDNQNLVCLLFNFIY